MDSNFDFEFDENDASKDKPPAKRRKKGITPASAKQKGRKFQQAIRDALLDTFKGILQADDIRSTSMGAAGDDLLLSPLAKAILPFNVECKKVEAPSLWQALAQANVRTSDSSVAITVFSRNKVKLPQSIVCMPTFFFRYFLFAGRPYTYDWSAGLIPRITAQCFEDAADADATSIDATAIDATGQQWRLVMHKPPTFNLWTKWPEYQAQAAAGVPIAVAVCRANASQTLCTLGSFLRLVRHHWDMSEAKRRLCPQPSP